MEKKTKVHLTNEEVASKFKSNFDLVNYAIKLAENMIKTGRDARVKSEIQNRAMLILEEIQEGKDQFDEIKTTTSSSSPEIDLDGAIPQAMIYEERMDKRKYRTAEAYESEE
jgi:DNA-directed RNA polymerase subunit omega